MEGNQHVGENHPHFSENHHHDQHQQAQKKTPFDKEKAKAKFWEFVQDIEKLGDEYLVEKAPYTFPDQIKEVVVKFAPYLVVLGLVIQLPTILSIFGIGTLLSYSAPFSALFLLIGALIAIVSFILQVKAIKPLFARAKIGWRNIFYALLLNFVVAVLTGTIVWPIIWSLVSLYIIFQLKDKYRN